MKVCIKVLLQKGTYCNTVFWDNPLVTLQACLGTIESYIRSKINLSQF